MTILDPNFNGLPKPTDWNKVIVPLQQANEKEFRGATLNELGANLNIEMSVNAQRIPSVPPGPLPAGPADLEVFMEIKEPGSWTWKTNPPLTNVLGDISTFWWNKTDWKKNDRAALPTAPVSNDFGTSITQAISQNKVTELKDSVEPTIENVGGSTNLFNPIYKKINTTVGSTGNTITNAAYAGYETYVGLPWLGGVTRTYSGYPFGGVNRYYVFRDSAGVNVGNGIISNSQNWTMTAPLAAVNVDILVKRPTDPASAQLMLNNGNTALPYLPYVAPIQFIKKIGGKEIVSTTLLVGNEIPASNNPKGAVNKSEMDTAIAEAGGGGEAYNQPLNTFDNVNFNSIGAGQITPSVLVLNLPTNEADVESNEVWIDTTSGNVLKVKP